ncbi:AAA family ATPase [Streptomyces venezuelae]|uniref:AAA family ATPase n=1 Tax=Streptomyces venezuelae TaxID=54571 RepID=UPI003456EB45
MESERGAETAYGPRGVVVITGIMASGKSTVAQALAERLPRAAHVRGDAFRRMIVSGGVPYEGAPGGAGEAQLRLRYRLSASAAGTYSDAGFTAVVQDVILGEELKAYVELIRTRPAYVVVLAPHPEAVAAREEARGKTGYGAWTVADLDAILRERTPRLGLWLDSGELTVDETVDAILSRLDEARVR